MGRNKKNTNYNHISLNEKYKEIKISPNAITYQN